MAKKDELIPFLYKHQAEHAPKYVHEAEEIKWGNTQLIFSKTEQKDVQENV